MSDRAVLPPRAAGDSGFRPQEPVDVLREAAESVLAAWDDFSLAPHYSADAEELRLKIEALRHGVIVVIRSKGAP